MLNVSKRTIERRLQEYNLSISQTYSNLSGYELNEKVTKIIIDFPHIGYRTVGSMLESQGHRVQEKY